MDRRNYVCDRLSQIGNVCMNMVPEEAFKFSAYIASHFYNDILNEIDLAIVVAKILEDENCEVDKEAAQYLPLVVDQLFNVDFAENFREICSYVFGYNQERIIRGKEYPKYAVEAAKWWSMEVLNPSMEEIPKAFAKIRRQYSEYEEKIFKETLAEEIIKDVEKIGSCYIFCNWRPNRILERAGRKLGINSYVGYPPKRKMIVFKEEFGFERAGDTDYTIIKL